MSNTLSLQSRVEHAMDNEDSSEREARLIVKYNGKEHDLTRFGKFHPGGKRTLERFAGHDVAETLVRTRHSQAAMRLVPEYRVSQLLTQQTDCGGLEQGVIDWSRPLMGQVGGLGDNYQAWLLAPVDRQLRLFDSDLMEALTVTSPRTTLLVWPPVITLLAIAAYQRATLDQRTSLSAVCQVFSGWALGMVLWPLVEYAVHRWVFHSHPPSTSRLLIALHFGLHGLHHKSPFDERRLLFPPGPALFVAGLAFIPLYAALSLQFAIALIAGALTGFLAYDLTHFYLHTGSPPPGSRLYRLKRRHNQHHFAQFDKGYGISSSFWDHVFKTGITLKDIGFDLRW